MARGLIYVAGIDYTKACLVARGHALTWGPLIIVAAKYAGGGQQRLF